MEETSSNIQTTETVPNQLNVVGEINRRKYKGKKMKNSDIQPLTHEPFSTVTIEHLPDTKIKESILVPIESDYSYKLVSADEYDTIYENEVLVDRENKKVFIELNDKSTLDEMVTFHNSIRNRLNRSHELKNVYGFSRTLVENYQITYVYNDVKYNFKF